MVHQESTSCSFNVNVSCLHFCHFCPCHPPLADVPDVPGSSPGGQSPRSAVIAAQDPMATGQKLAMNFMNMGYIMNIWVYYRYGIYGNWDMEFRYGIYYEIIMKFLDMGYMMNPTYAGITWIWDIWWKKWICMMDTSTSTPTYPSYSSHGEKFLCEPPQQKHRF